MKVRELLKASLQKRDRRGTWFYLVWLVCYCTAAFITTAETAAQGHDYIKMLMFFLVPLVAGCIYLRYPSVLGWSFVVAPPTLIAVGVLVDSGEFLLARDFGGCLAGLASFAFLALVLFGFIHYRPFWRRHAA